MSEKWTYYTHTVREFSDFRMSAATLHLSVWLERFAEKHPEMEVLGYSNQAESGRTCVKSCLIRYVSSGDEDNEEMGDVDAMREVLKAERERGMTDSLWEFWKEILTVDEKTGTVDVAQLRTELSDLSDFVQHKESLKVAHKEHTKKLLAKWDE